MFSNDTGNHRAAEETDEGSIRLFAGGPDGGAPGMEYQGRRSSFEFQFGGNNFSAERGTPTKNKKTHKKHF